MDLQLTENIQHISYLSQLSAQLWLEIHLINNPFSLKNSGPKFFPEINFQAGFCFILQIVTIWLNNATTPFLWLNNATTHFLLFSFTQWIGPSKLRKTSISETMRRCYLLLMFLRDQMLPINTLIKFEVNFLLFEKCSPSHGIIHYINFPSWVCFTWIN